MKTSPDGLTGKLNQVFKDIASHLTWELSSNIPHQDSYLQESEVESE